LAEKYECPKCYEQYKSQSEYLAHMRGHYGGAGAGKHEDYIRKEPEPRYPMKKKDIIQLVYDTYGVVER